MTIQLRPAQLNNRRSVYEWLYFSDFSADLNRYQGITPETIPAYETFCEDFADYYFDGSAPEKGRSYMLVEPGQDEAIGVISYTAYYLLPHLAEFDIWLAGLRYANGGRGTEAIYLLATQLFDSGYREIIIRPAIQNKRAIRAYEKAGFMPKPDWQAADYYRPEFIDELAVGDCGPGGDIFMVKKK
jgi:RimJ/RimL family protein N-acetyltransferase